MHYAIVSIQATLSSGSYGVIRYDTRETVRLESIGSRSLYAMY
jgi:hypothetical protein